MATNNDYVTVSLPKPVAPQTLLTIPGEIRNQIFLEVFAAIDADNPGYATTKTMRFIAGVNKLLVVNKQFRDEAKSLFWSDYFPHRKRNQQLMVFDLAKLRQLYENLPEHVRGLLGGRAMITYPYRWGRVTRHPSEYQEIVDQGASPGYLQVHESHIVEHIITADDLASDVELDRATERFPDKSWRVYISKEGVEVKYNMTGLFLRNFSCETQFMKVIMLLEASLFLIALRNSLRVSFRTMAEV